MLAIASEELRTSPWRTRAEFVAGIAAANAELPAGETVSLTDIRKHLEADKPPGAR